MIISVFNGSPKPDGSIGRLLHAFVTAAQACGHDVRLTHLYELTIGGCRDCGNCKNTGGNCCQKDDFTNRCAMEIDMADCIVLGSPIYFGQITGPLKTFLDRWCRYFSADFRTQRLQRKKFITMTASASPAQRFTEVTEYLKYWLGDFFKMEYAGSLMAGDLPHQDSLDAQPDLLEQARDLARNL